MLRYNSPSREQTKKEALERDGYRAGLYRMSRQRVQGDSLLWFEAYLKGKAERFRLLALRAIQPRAELMDELTVYLHGSDPKS